jgi:uncharacterized membrane protein HdeD (DUF308 family)
MKILAIVLGILMILSGVFCLASPGLTYMTLAWVIGVCMVVESIGDLCTYQGRRALGIADGWSLAGAIITLLLGIVLMISNTMQLTVDSLLVVFAAIWLIVMGVTRIIVAMRMHQMREMLPKEIRGSRWVWTLILGILLIVCGILGILNPTVLMLAIGLMIGLSIIISGANLIALATVV